MWRATKHPRRVLNFDVLPWQHYLRSRNLSHFTSDLIRSRNSWSNLWKISKPVWASELHIDNHRCLPGIWMTYFTEFGAIASLRQRQVESPSAVVSVLGPAGVHREAAWLWFPDPSGVPQLLPILNSTRQQASQSHLPHQWPRHHALRETGRRLFRSGETWRMAGPVWKSGWKKGK